MISAALEPRGLVIRVTGRDRALAWPHSNEVVVPPESVSGATYHPDLATLPDQERLFCSVGRGVRTLPVVSGHWVFGRRRMNNEQFYFAVRGRNTPLLIVAARHGQLDGVVVSTPDAAEIAAELSAIGEFKDRESGVSRR